MHQIIHAVGVFVHHLAAVHWQALGIAVVCHILKLMAVSRAWRNVVAAAYPESRVPWPRMFAAYVAGTGVNSIIPARGGDVVKLFIAKRRLEGATYPTLAATVVLMTLLDSAIAAGFALWAIAIGVLPALKLLPHLPSFDFRWLFGHPRFAGILISAVLAVLLVGGTWAGHRIEEFWTRVKRGFAILQTPRLYLRRVVFWQLVDWTLRLTTIYWLLRAFGLPATLHNALLVQVSQSLASIFPISPSGIGTEQAFLLYIFRGRAARTVLLSFSVGMRVTLTVVNVVLGFSAILLTLRTLRFRQAVAPDYSTGSPR